MHCAVPFVTRMLKLSRMYGVHTAAFRNSCHVNTISPDSCQKSGVDIMKAFKKDGRAVKETHAEAMLS